MRQLFFECSSGISGDMTVAALLDLGADEEVLRNALRDLLPGEFTIDIHRVLKNGISACKFDVILTDHEHEAHCHAHRNLSCITDIINSSAITSGAKELAHKIFRIVAEAESKVHGVDIDEVHFHEVGATDSIVDIIGTAVCIDNLGIRNIAFSAMSEGTGQVHCQHGWLTVPVPAVIEIVKSNQLILKTTDNDGEMITPTGAAIAAALRNSDGMPMEYTIEAVGVGAGTKDFKRPNILRVLILNNIKQVNETKMDVNTKTDTDIKSDADTIQINQIGIKQSGMNHSGEGDVWVLVTNIDDTTGEALGYTMEKLFEHGALDVWYQPVFMKKNRPAYMLSLMCSYDRIPELENIIFANTTTIGIRRYRCERTILQRSSDVCSTRFGQVRVKICRSQCVDDQHADALRIYPEHESIREIADRTGDGYTYVYNQVLQDINQDVAGRSGL